MTRKGDQIDLYEPPEHCGQPMTVWDSADNSSRYDVVCAEDEFTVHTDHDGNVLRTGRA
ncbi:hypothetical protein [Streptomyces sp. NPDC005732]|uniref:hypothetical protein n=1 Tax=Streptomyces sp. NPDC005732 TaxID=3157057 RepID=UPI0033E22602